MSRLLTLSLLIALALPFSPNASAVSTTTGDSALENWKEWILAKHPDHRCHYFGNQKKNVARLCAWSSELSLLVNDSGGRFEQSLQVLGDSWITLPGSEQHWPKNVSLNGKPAQVLAKQGRPTLFLVAGDYRIDGQFSWRRLPQRLRVPDTIGLLALSIKGQLIERPARDQAGNLWLQRNKVTTSNEANTARVEVFRSISEGVPRRLTTLVKINVSGEPRELTTGTLQLANTVTERFTSPLPARIEADGRLRIQVRSGQWQLEHVARIEGDINQLAMKKSDDLWPEQEIWGYQAAPQIRRVKVTGASLLDGSQLDIPRQLAGQPLYLLAGDAQLILEEQYRGDADPQANRLEIARNIWLDFDGEGGTIEDSISGSMYQDWRLEALPGLELGRADVRGQAQVITRLDEHGGAGIEIREAAVALTAVSRVETTGALTATGWQSDFDHVRATLHIPPGWRLWHVAGPDTVGHSWLSRWDLWGIFLSLIIVGSVYRLLGIRSALLALATGALTYHESGSPFLAMVLFIVLLPLVRVVPDGRLFRWIRNTGYLALVVVALTLLDFSVQQMRTAFYPQLEYGKAINGGRYASAKDRVTSPAAMRELAVEQSTMGSLEDIETKKAKLNAYDAIDPPRPRIDASANVQTGPGLPTWSWHQIHLGWSGPVQANETLQLYLTKPWLTRLLKVIEVVLTTALFIGVGFAFYRAAHDGHRAQANATLGSGEAAAGTVASALVGILFLLGIGGFSTPVDANPYPPKYLLDDYEKRLIKAPQCSPDCVAINAVDITIERDELIIRQRVSTGTDLALAVPSSREWQPQTILVNGQRSVYVHRENGVLYIPVTAGHHEVLLKGSLQRSEVTVDFPVAVHNISLRSEGWNASGIVNQRLPGKTLSLKRQRKVVAQNTLLADTPPPFALVTRKLLLDTDWFVETTVQRVAPPTGPISLSVPLLAGESVLTHDSVVDNGAVNVSLGAKQQRFQWRSQMTPTSNLEWVYGEGAQWTERWIIDESPRWHIAHSGLPPIKPSNAQQPSRTWLPWPGETLSLRIDQPAPIAGPTMTVESINTVVRPGARVVTNESQLNITSSTGGDYSIGLPAGATVKSFSVNGDPYATQADDNQLIASLAPGDNNVQLQWEQAGSIPLRMKTPVLTLDTPANNVTIALEVPRDRWPLLALGPSIGPAMLYWGVLAVIVALAIGLGYVKGYLRLSMPMGCMQWFLLGLGMSTVNTAGCLLVVVWFFAMEYRRRYVFSDDDVNSRLGKSTLFRPGKRTRFNVMQIGLAALTVAAVIVLLTTIPMSLLSAPDMKVTGNDSSNYYMQWYADNAGEKLPQATLISVSLWVYRLAMLAWSLWLVFALLRWANWGWQSYSAGGFWLSKPSAVDEAKKSESRHQHVSDNPRSKNPSSKNDIDHTDPWTDGS